jgi:hypothetical protein
METKPIGDKVGEGVAKLKEAAGAIPSDWLQTAAMWGIVIVCVLVALYIARRILKGRKTPTARLEPELTIDVMALPTAGPPASGPALYYYNVPVRLVAIIVAPAGRVRELPPLDQMSHVFDAIVPGLAQVVAAHRPIYRRWPSQLSARGFAHMFFGHVRLPGQGGKGTPWCSVAGIFKIEGQTHMAALLMRAETTTNLGQHTVEEEAQWLDIVRVKT